MSKKNGFESWTRLFAVISLILFGGVAGCGGSGSPPTSQGNRAAEGSEARSQSTDSTITLPNKKSEPSGGADREIVAGTRHTLDDEQAAMAPSQAVPEPTSADIGGAEIRAGGSASAALDPHWKQEAIASRARIVDVFFATDRGHLEELAPRLDQVFLPALFIALMTTVFFVGSFIVKRFALVWMVTSGLAACLFVLSLHAAVIRWQQIQRLLQNSDVVFTGQRYQPQAQGYAMHVGVASVTLPPNHKPGRLESADVVKFQWVEKTSKHIVLQQVEPVKSTEQWYTRLQDEMAKAPECEAFLFVHGYNVTFDDAVKRTAQLAADLELVGPAICYSWPSRGTVAGYPADEATVSWSAPHLEQLLCDIKQKTGCRSINVLAHSMGNRVLLEALERIALKNPTYGLSNSASPSSHEVQGEPMLDQVVLAAPDVDAATFASRYSRAATHVAHHITMYASTSDWALGLSDGLHGASRMGRVLISLAGEHGVEAIDVSGSDPVSFGHAYYGNSPELLRDLRAVLHQDCTASARPWLVPKTTERGHTYWRLQETKQATTATNADSRR